MLKKRVGWLESFINRHIITANILFAISVVALAVLFSSSGPTVRIVNLVVFPVVVVAVCVKFRLLRLFASKIDYRKLFCCGALAALLCVLATGTFYGRVFQNVVDGGGTPWWVKTIYDSIPVPGAVLNTAIVAACVVCAVFGICAIIVALVLIVDFTLYISRKPVNYLLCAGDGDLSKTTIRTYRRFGAAILVFMAIVMVVFSSAQSFWVDELYWTIGKVANKSFPDISRQLLQDGYNMPLFYYVLRLIYPLMPYGEGYLLSLSMVSVILGVVFIYMAAREIGGLRLAFISLCLAALSGVLLQQGAWELRPYSFFFCFSALTVLFYIKRLIRESLGNILLYGVAMAFLLYSHWFGAVMLVFYGICDLFLCIRKKIKFRCIVSYLFAMAAIAPWALLMLNSLGSDASIYWADVPGLLAPLISVGYLLSGNMLCLPVFAIAVLIFFVVLRQKLRLREWDLTLFIWIQMLLSCVWTIGVTFVYSRFINREGSVYVERYFFALVPHAVLIAAFGVDCIGRLMVETKLTKAIEPTKALAGFLVVVGVCNYTSAILSVKTIHEPFREYSEFLARDEKVYSDDSLVIISEDAETWVEYYFLKRGVELPGNIAGGARGPLALVVAGGEVVDRVDLALSDIPGYGRVYYSDIRNEKNDAELLDFLESNFTKTYEDSKLRLVLFEK